MEEYISKTDLLYCLEKLPSVGVKVEDCNNGWIKASEKKPPKLEDVLVTDGQDMFVAWCHKGEWHTRDSAYNPQLYDIKAWQPLPQPYRDEE